MGIHRRSTLALALLVLMGALLMVVMTGEGADAQVTEVTVTIAENDRDQTARPTDTEHDILEFRGEIALDKTIWIGQSVKLTPELLMPNAPSLWEVTFNPTDITYTASGVENFTATVVVPSGLAVTTRPYTLVFNVTTSDLLFYNLNEGFAQVSIAQYYKIGRLYSTLPLKVTQGERIEFNITIINRGNGEDTFLLTVSNLLELSDAGLTVIAPPSSGRVGPGAVDDVKLLLQADDDAILSEFSLNLTITSEESQSDPDHSTVTSFAEWTVVVEAGIGTTITNNLKYIIPGVILVVAVIAFVLFRRKKMREREEREVKEREEGKKKKKKKSSKGSKGSKSTRPKKPSKGPKPSSDDGPEDKYYGD